MEAKKRNALLLMFISLAGLYYVWDQVYSPGKEQLATDQARLDALETSNRNAELTYIRGGGDIEEQLAVYERHAVRLEQLIPSQEEVPALLRSVQLEAGRAGVQLGDFAPDIAEPAAYYSKESYALSVIGEYHDVGRFMTAIASLPRVVTPVQADLSRFSAQQAEVYEDMEDPVRVDFRIETYVLPELTGGAPPPEVGGSRSER